MSRYLPYVFTEEGVAMLASILKTSIAEKVSIDIMRAFVAMRHYIGNNEYRISNIETKVIEHDNSIMLLQESFNKSYKYKYIYMGFGNVLCVDKRIYDKYYPYLLGEVKKDDMYYEEEGDNYNPCLNYSHWEYAIDKMTQNEKD